MFLGDHTYGQFERSSFTENMAMNIGGAIGIYGGVISNFSSCLFKGKQGWL